MAESTDKKTRRIAEKRVESGKEFESYQEAQNQLLAIQAEQQQNLAVQANNAMNMQAQRQTLGQAAEIMAMDGLNSTTRNVLGGYGLSQPRVIKETKVVKQGPQNITINNNTTNIQGGPVQGRDVSIKPKEDTQGKFKAWLTNVFARQDAQFQKQNLEYQRRESSLTRNANKMMRKLEGLGKDITTAMDPRKMAQRMSNPFMNMLKTIGLIGLATRLPKILNFIDNAETKIRGWIDVIGEKVGGIFNGDGNGLDLDDPKTFIGKIRFALWNKEETGIFNVVLEKLSRALYDRKQLADNILKDHDWGSILQPGQAVKGLLDWLSVFFGGTKAARSMLNKEKESEIRDSLALGGDESVGSKELAAKLKKGNGISLTDNSGNAVLVKKNGGGVDIEKEYQDWATKNGITEKDRSKASIKQRFLKERGGDLLAYFGEADILTARLHNVHRTISTTSGLNGEYKGKSGVSTLRKLDLTPLGDRLSTSSYRGTLAASLDIYKELKGEYGFNGYSAPNVRLAYIAYSIFSPKNQHNIDINMERLLYLLKLLSKANDIIVFEKFTDMFKIPSNDTELVNIKLINKSISGTREREFYQGGYDFSTYYRKIVYESAEGDKIKLVEEPDFNNQIGQDHWRVVKIEPSVIRKIIYNLVGTNNIEDYTIDTQELALKNLKDQGIIYEGRMNATQKQLDALDHYSKYEKSMSGIREIEYEAEMYEQGRSSSNPQYSSTARANLGGGKFQTLNERGNLTTNKISSEERRANAKKIFDFLKKNGFTNEQAAGIAGVIQQESNFNPAAINIGEYKAGKPFGEGICQWSNSRKGDFEAWWKDKYPGRPFPGIHAVSLDDQLEFFLQEFKKRRVYNSIRALSTDNLTPQEIIEQTVDLFTRGFENGSNAGPATKESMEDTYRKHHKNFVSYEDTIWKPRLKNASGIYNSFIGSIGNSDSNDSSNISTIESTDSSPYGLNLLSNSNSYPTSSYSYMGGTATKTNTPTSNATTAGKNVKTGNKSNKSSQANTTSYSDRFLGAASVATAQEVAEVNANTKCFLQYQSDTIAEIKGLRADIKNMGKGNKSPKGTDTKNQQV